MRPRREARKPVRVTLTVWRWPEGWQFVTPRGAYLWLSWRWPFVARGARSQLTGTIRHIKTPAHP